MKLDMTILYVSDVAASAAFFSAALGTAPREASPGFAWFDMPHGMKLGLWKREGVLPAAAFSGASAEIVIHVETDAEVDKAYETYRSLDLDVIDPPVTREFGHSLVIEGPDAHRLRVLRTAG